MKLRQRLRFVERMASAIAVPDTDGPRPVAGGLLFSCHDVDRSMVGPEGLRFSPLLEGIRQLAAPATLPVSNLTHPWATFPGHRVQGGSVTVNRRIMALRLRAKLRRRAGLDDESEFYARVLGHLRPRFVFSIQPPAGLCLAARRAGIPLAEAMHGTNVSLADEVFVREMSRPDEWQPQIVISYDDVTHGTVSTLCEGRPIRALRAGDPWLIACRRQRHVQGALPGRRERRALVTLQWGYDGERAALSGIVPDGVFHPALEQAIAEAARDGWTFLVRMHPIQMNAPGYRHHRRRIQALAARHANVEVAQATSWPLPLLLDEVAGHITLSSSAVGEAAVAGVRSLTLCPTLHAGGAHEGLFHELRDAGMVDFGRLDATSIVGWLAQCAPPPMRTTHDDAAAFEREARFYSDLIGEAAHARQGVPA